jgi:hypothetical protein
LKHFLLGVLATLAVLMIGYENSATVAVRFGEREPC